MKYYFGCYDPLQYPLFFPNREVGWHRNIKRRDKREISAYNQQSTIIPTSIAPPTFTSAEDIFIRESEGKFKFTNLSNIIIYEHSLTHKFIGVKVPKPGKVSCQDYYCHKLHIRDSRQSILLKSVGRLFHQYVVNMYIKLETTRFVYFRNKQSEIRAELFQGIVDSVAAGEANTCQVGKRIVLPSSFIGGPRDMHYRYLDAISLVQQFKKPDLFITMTCNPEWEEITEQLHPGQTHNDRPDLTSSIF